MQQLVELVKEHQNAMTAEENLKAATTLLDETAPSILSYIRAESHYRHFSKEQAEDIFQEIMKAWATGLTGWKGEEDAQYWGWCYRIARNKIIDVVRKLASPHEDPTDLETLERYIEESGKEHAMSAADRMDFKFAMDLLEKAKPPCFHYLWSYYILGWTCEEVADTYAVAVDTMEKRIARCLETARQLIAAHS